MIRKIALIEPISDIPNIYSLWILPRLGILTVAAALREAGYEVEVYNDLIHRPGRTDLRRCDLVGISILTNTAVQGYRYAQSIKEERPVVFGGYHPTFLPEEALGYGHYVVRGEGEETLPELIDALHGRRTLESVLGLSYRKDGRIYHNPDRPSSERCLHLSPDYLSVRGLDRRIRRPVRGYLFRLRFAAGTHTSRGCPRNCRYCTVIHMAGRRLRYRDMDQCVEELQNASHLTRKDLFIADDNLTINMPRAKDFVRRLIAAGIPNRYTLTMQIEVAAFQDDELLSLLREANFELLHVGYESISEETLRNWHKPITRDQLLLPSQQARKHGLRLNGMFVVGSDCDTEETIRHTVDFAIESDLATLQMWILTPLPGSGIYREACDENRIFNTFWKHYDCQHSTFFPKRIRPSTLQRAVREANRRFYTLPRIYRGPGNRLTYGLNSYRMDEWMKRYTRKLQAVEDSYYDGENLRPERLAGHNPDVTTSCLHGNR